MEIYYLGFKDFLRKSLTDTCISQWEVSLTWISSGNPSVPIIYHWVLQAMPGGLHGPEPNGKIMAQDVRGDLRVTVSLLGSWQSLP